jgi:hypothetical protein
MTASRRGKIVVAALLVSGVLAAALVMRIREHAGSGRDPAALLPTAGLLAALDGPNLGTRLLDLRRAPGFRALLSADGSTIRARAFGWKSSVPDPLAHVPVRGTCALGLYRGGWALVLPSGSRSPRGLPYRELGGFAVTASDRTILDGRRGGSSSRGRPAGDAIAVRVDIAAWLGATSRGRRAWAGHAPTAANGTLAVSTQGIGEMWTLECGEGCFLDLLAEGPGASSEAAGWAAVPENAVAVEWLRLDPRRLASWGGAPAGAKADGALARLERIEQFLGVPLRQEIVRALAGPCLAAIAPPRAGEPPEPLLLFDLADPGVARKVLDRVVALGVVSGSMLEDTYRGVPIASWRRHGSRGGVSPSAAVDGNVLIIGFRRGAVADAIDRRREHGQSASVERLRSELDALGPASWKAASRSGALAESWESLLGLSSGFAPAGVLSRGALSRERGAWVLRGDGNAPAWMAEEMLPAARRLLGVLGLEGGAPSR